MNAPPDPQLNVQALEQERRRISQRLEEVARLCEANIPAATFYGEMLKRLLESLAAPAGAVWARTAQGNLQLQFQINLKEIGLDRSEEARASHEELLRQMMTQPRPLHLPPHSAAGAPEAGKVAAGNPTDHLLLIVPIVLNEQVAGLIEVWQPANRPAQAAAGFLQYMGFMAELAARYQRNQMMGQLVGQQQVWTQLEAFARQVHGSLHPVEVSYLVANEGRRLIECDRVCVGVRYGHRTRIEAVSGADIVEKRSNLVQTMRKLCEHVLKWGEKLVFTGTRDDSLPPKVLAALDAYLAASPSKLLVVQPLRDDRESGKKPPRAALVMECFEPPSDPQQLIARLDVVARHATPALYNAVEHRRIPMRFLWAPLAMAQEGIGGKAQAISAVVITALSLLIASLIFVPYPLKMDSTGKLVPEVRRVVYPPAEGEVLKFEVWPGETVRENRNLALLHDLKLGDKVQELTSAITRAQIEAATADLQARTGPESERGPARSKAELQSRLVKSKEEELDEFLKRTNALRDKLGHFELKAPEFTAEERRRIGSPEWTVLSGNFRDEWTARKAQPSDPLLRLGAKNGPWEIEMKIPQKHISQVLMAYERNGGKPLDVDFLLKSDPTRTYKGKLHRDKIASEAIANRDDNNESEPEVIAFVNIDDDDIEAASRLPLIVPRQALTSGTEVHAKVRCGSHALGYSLLYGVWEFFYEKVVFFF